ncbi:MULTISPECIES: hypothetical protein [Oceanobacillus]|uniref:hypothetical protein n=1 Tax=Oceanobacillus TaxID=182709 RepID=UPI000595DAC3|nr:MULTISPECIES: hypothetical protein [Oceanobacillus]
MEESIKEPKPDNETSLNDFKSNQSNNQVKHEAKEQYENRRQEFNKVDISESSDYDDSENSYTKLNTPDEEGFDNQE